VWPESVVKIVAIRTSGHFRARFSTFVHPATRNGPYLFLSKELIDQARVNMLKDWKHSGFSIEGETRLFSKADREALGQYVVRGATSAEKIQYNSASDTAIWTVVPKGFYKGKTEIFKGFEFVDQFVAPLPPRRVQLVRRYG